MQKKLPRVTFLMTTLGDGGIGKMRVHLTREIANRGIPVDMLLGKTEGPYVERLDTRMGVYHLGTSHGLWSIPKIARYLAKQRPYAVVAEKLRVNVALLRAMRIARVSSRVVASIHGVLSHKLDLEGLSEKKRRTKHRLVARYYPRNDAFVTVSRGIADDLIQHFSIPRDKVHVVSNPAVTEELHQLAAERPAHPWLIAKDVPVILGVGRLEPQKDFATLIKAFAGLRARQACRLIILGEGEQRPHLEALIETLGIGDDVALPGYAINPYSAMANADLFVLSSQWEGSPNVVTEALAVGVPVVSTDCPGRPSETLQNGRYGPLVPVGDVEKLTEAMAKTLADPFPAQVLKEAVIKYTPPHCADGYLRAMDYPLIPMNASLINKD